MWRAWRPYSWFSSTYPSVMIGVIEKISHSTPEMCRSTIVHVQYFSAVIHKLNISGRMLIWTFFLVLVCETRAKLCPHLSVTSSVSRLLSLSLSLSIYISYSTGKVPMRILLKTWALSGKHVPTSRF
jgi:hypothetical protein